MGYSDEGMGQQKPGRCPDKDVVWVRLYTDSGYNSLQSLSQTQFKRKPGIGSDLDNL